jgi:hypothetical protein
LLPLDAYSLSPSCEPVFYLANYACIHTFCYELPYEPLPRNLIKGISKIQIKSVYWLTMFIPKPGILIFFRPGSRIAYPATSKEEGKNLVV